jgi:hypothetical protein
MQWGSLKKTSDEKSGNPKTQKGAHQKDLQGKKWHLQSAKISNKHARLANPAPLT